VASPWWPLASSLLILWSCGGKPSSGSPASAPAKPVEITEAESWDLADPSVDPFSSYAAGRVRCTKADFRPEASWLEVTTTQCNYVTFVHQLANSAAAGSVIRGQIAWATLAAIDPAVGTLAFADDAGSVLWSHDVPIPSTSSLVNVEFELSETAAAGSSLFFHVRNHGYNSWQLSPLTLSAPDATP
jgi:hypothetical protein